MKKNRVIAALKFCVGMTCGTWLALSTIALIGSLSFQGIIWVGNGLERIEKPIKKVGTIAIPIMGISAVGCVLCALDSRAWKDADLEEIERARLQKKASEAIEISELKAQLAVRSEQVNNWVEWWATASTLDEGYDIVGCRGCKNFVGEYIGDDNPKFFVCAMHPYGQRKCEDKK